MKKKLFVGVITVSLLAVTGTAVFAYNQVESAKEATINDAEKAVDSLYNSDRTRLAEKIDSKIKKAEVAVRKVKEEKVHNQLSKEIRDVKEIAEIQQEVYSTLENGILVETITKEKVTDIYKKLSDIKSINESIYQHLTEYLSEADAQVASIDAAFVKMKEAESNLNRETYNSALALVEEVKNEVKKDELKKQLATVNEKIVALEEENRKKEEVRVAAEKEAVTKQENSATSSKASTNTGKTTTSNSSNKTSSSTSNSHKSNGSTEITDVKKTGEGTITNFGSEDQTGANTYEEGTFTMPQEYYDNR